MVLSCLTFHLSTYMLICKDSHLEVPKQEYLMKKRVELALVVIILNILNGCHNTELKLSEDNKNDFVIVADFQKSVHLKKATEELQVHLQRVLKTAPAIITVNIPDKNKKIILGKEFATQCIKEDFDWNILGTDGFIIKTKDNNLIIAGNTDQGTLNGVYSFLEDVIGIRWLTPEDTYYPDLKTVSLDGLNIIFVPTFKYRQMYNINAKNPVWSLRQRLTPLLDCKIAPQAHNTYFFLCEALSAQKAPPHAI